MLYKIIVLGSISTADRDYKTEADIVIYEHETIVFKKKILKDNRSYEFATMLAVPQSCSIVELVTI